MDEYILQIINLATSVDDLLSEISHIELLKKNRREHPTYESVYIVQPSPETVDIIVRDFATRPLYQRAHLYFTGRLDDRLFYKLKSSAVRKYVANLRDVPLDFLPIEKRVFSLDFQEALTRLFGVAMREDQVTEECQIIAEQIASYWVTVRILPDVRYQRSSPNNVCQKIAERVLKELDDYAKMNEGYFRAVGETPVLLIADRTLDLKAPLIWEFSYQAMANDLVYLRKQGRVYRYSPSGVKQDEKDADLDDRKDSIWESTRHAHIAEVSDSLSESLRNIQSKLKGGAQAEETTVSLNNLRKVLADLPDLKQAKELISIHVSMAQDCIKEMEERKIQSLAELGQDFANGETVDGRAVRNPEDLMSVLVDDRDITEYDKVRLLILYALQYGGFAESDMPRWFKKLHAKHLDSVNGLKQFGIALYRPEGFQPSKPSGRRWKQQDDSPVDKSTCRYEPKLKQVLKELCDGRLPETEFPYARDPRPTNMNVDSAADGFGSGSTFTTPLRSIKPTWHKRELAEKLIKDLGLLDAVVKKEEEDGKPTGPLISVFMAGGATYSESRCVYELSKSEKRVITLGTTHFSVGDNFLRDLRTLRPRKRSHR